MVDPDFSFAVRTSVQAVQSMIARHQLTPMDAAALVSAVALETIALAIGKAAAVEQLRTVADLAERELLSPRPMLN